MKLRVVLSLACAALVAPMLSACTPVVDTATPTPVDFKACMISSPAGFNDGGINQESYFGLLQSEAQYGVSTSVVELDREGTNYRVVRAARKLVARGCNVVFAVGDTRGQLATLANGNPGVQFVEIDPRPSAGTLQPTPNRNLVSINFDHRVAYLQAGYLAAAVSKSGKVAIIGVQSDSTVASEIWYFRQGVYQYSEKVGKLVEILGAQRAEANTWKLLPADAKSSQVKQRTQQLIDAGADVLLPIGVNGLAAAQVALSSRALVIGSDSDWAVQDRYASAKEAILASVVKAISQIVVARIAAGLGVDESSPAATVPAETALNFDAKLTDENAVSYAGYGPALNQLAADYLAGTSTVLEPDSSTISK